MLSSLSVPLLPLATDVAPAAAVLASVLLSLVTIHFASKLGGEVTQRLGLPPVLGELLAGVIVGVSVLHLVVFPEGGGTAGTSVILQLVQWVHHLDTTALGAVFDIQSEVINILAELGVIILLFEIGLELDLRQLTKVGVQAVVVAVAGVALPFVLGTVGLITLFHTPTIPAIFAGAALTATSIGITSKVLAELGQLQSREGQIIVGAAVIDDVLGIIVLAVVASLAKTGTADITHVVVLIVSSVAFLGGAILFGNVFNKTFVGVVAALKTRGNVVIPAIGFAFLMAFLADALQLEAILGAFAAGLVLDETDARHELEELIKPVSDLVVPIFFVVVGAKSDLTLLNPFVTENRAGLVLAGFLVVIGILTKLSSGWLVFGQAGVNRLAIGLGMVPRGEVGLVFAGIGTAVGAFDKPLEVAIVIMVILTTFVAPPLLRLAFGRSEPPMVTLEEQAP
ncbi:cation:proton antiporter [Thermosynechococcaceae cyanobacterium Okahandja]